MAVRGVRVYGGRRVRRADRRSRDVLPAHAAASLRVGVRVAGGLVPLHRHDGSHHHALQPPAVRGPGCAGGCPEADPGGSGVPQMAHDHRRRRRRRRGPAGHPPGDGRLRQGAVRHPGRHAAGHQGHHARPLPPTREDPRGFRAPRPGGHRVGSPSSFAVRRPPHHLRSAQGCGQLHVGRGLQELLLAHAQGRHEGAHRRGYRSLHVRRGWVQQAARGHRRRRPAGGERRLALRPDGHVRGQAGPGRPGGHRRQRSHGASGAGHSR